jgi:hypothetical protein
MEDTPEQTKDVFRYLPVRLCPLLMKFIPRIYTITNDESYPSATEDLLDAVEQD